MVNGVFVLIKCHFYAIVNGYRLCHCMTTIKKRRQIIVGMTIIATVFCVAAVGVAHAQTTTTSYSISLEAKSGAERVEGYVHKDNASYFLVKKQIRVQTSARMF